jgi:hypothetical protein
MSGVDIEMLSIVGNIGKRSGFSYIRQTSKSSLGQNLPKTLKELNIIKGSSD